MSETTTARLQAIQEQFRSKSGSGRLDGAVAIVTGVGSLTGIGRASALGFAREGAKALYLLDFDGSNLDDLRTAVLKLAPQCKVVTLEGDAADEETIKGLCQRALDEHGALDVFFANAGVASGNRLENTDLDEYQRTMHVNAQSCFLACRYGSEAMRDERAGKKTKGGSIILTASVAGLRSGAGSVDYSASKAAVVSLAQTCAHQLAGTDVRVNAVCPGLIETGMTMMTFDFARSRGTQAKIGQLNPLKRYGVAEEIANAVIFLASDEASYVNGVALAVDGGLSSSHPVAPGRSF